MENKDKILERFKKTSVFQALNKSAQATIEMMWAKLDDDKLRKIDLLAACESFVFADIAKIGQEVFVDTQKSAMRYMVQKMENGERRQEQQILDQLINDNDS